MLVQVAAQKGFFGGAKIKEIWTRITARRRSEPLLSQGQDSAQPLLEPPQQTPELNGCKTGVKNGRPQNPKLE